MRLFRVTPAGLSHVRQAIAERGEPLEADDFDPRWVEPIEPEIRIDALRERVSSWSENAAADGQNAVELHRRLPLTRRLASDRGLWVWLACCAFGGYTFRRYPPDARGAINLDRTGTKLPRNAIARLWWTAERTRIGNPRAVCAALDLPTSDDEYEFTRRVFSTPTLHQELTYRGELMTRPFVAAFCALQHEMETGRLERHDAGEIAWACNLLFSTVVLDAWDGAGGRSNAIDVAPEACRDLRDFLRDALFGSARPTAVEGVPVESTADSRSRPGREGRSRAGRAEQRRGGLRALFERLRSRS